MNTPMTNGPDPDFAVLGPMDEQAAGPNTFRLDRVLHVAKRLWWVPLLTLLLSLAAGLSFMLTTEPTYISRASMWETVKLRLPDGSLFAEDTQNFLGTQSELLQSEALRQLALSRLRSSTNNAPIPLDKEGQPLPVNIRVNQSSKSAVFVLEASSSNARYTQAYLNALMEVYLEYKRNIRKVVSGDTLASISEQVERTERDLKAEQDSLLAFQKTNNLALLEEEAKVATSYLAKLRTELSDLRMETKLLESTNPDVVWPEMVVTNLPASTIGSTGSNDVPPANLDLAGPALEAEQSALDEHARLRMKQEELDRVVAAEQEAQALATNSSALASGNTNDSRAVAETGEASPLLTPEARQAAIQELQSLRARREELSRFLRADSPLLIQVNADINRAEAKAGELLRQQRQDELVASRNSIQLKMDSILTTIKEWEGKVVQANSRMAEAERLKLNVERVQSVYDRLEMLVQTVGISRNIDQETLAVLEHASPAKRTRKQEVSAAAASGVGGFALGLGILALITLRDDRLLTSVEVGEKLGEVIIGQVPALRGAKRNAPLPLLESNDARHAYAESYRNLRSALLFMATPERRPKVLLVTSALPGEGKSTVAANLARTLAFGGVRVLLVDGDIRKGHLHKLMSFELEPGVAELLTGRCPLEKVVQTNSLPNLSFISRGSTSAYPGDLFLGGNVDQVLNRLREEFDYVIIDSSPVFASDDVTTFAPKVDATLFVVRSDFSRARPVREALGLLYQRQVKVVGVILNQADSSDHSYYYYKYEDYYRTAKVG